MATKRCKYCGTIKSLDLIRNDQRYADGKSNQCKDCARKEATRRRQAGLKIIKDLAHLIGKCQGEGCGLLYDEENAGYFQWDHVDETLKLHNYETKGSWLVCHQQEFENRVRPNLQLLCVKCHKNKSVESMKAGGVAHQKIFGEQPLAEVVMPDINLFTPFVEDISEHTLFLYKEGNYAVTRNINGRIVEAQQLIK